jgi:acyl-homoserine lactone acylase PvdQ
MHRRHRLSLAAAPLAAAVLASAAVSLTALLPTTGAAASPRPGAPSAVPNFTKGDRGFHSVLAYGAGQTINAADLATYEATNKPPSTFTNQVDLYNRVITREPRSTADLSNFYKDSDFSVPTGNDVGSTEHPVTGATVIRDKTYAVPHIYANTRAEAMQAAGYVAAQDRLFLMDVLRRTAEGSTSELLGPSAAASDSHQLGQFDLSPSELTHEVKALPKEYGAQGRQALDDLTSYVAGINDYISQARVDPSKLPAEYPALGAMPRTWTLADTAAEAYLLIAQFTVAGDGEQLQSDIKGRLTHRLGARHGRQVYSDLRNFENPDTPTTTSQRFPSDRPGRVNPKANARITTGSISDRNAVVGKSPAASPAAQRSSSSYPAWAEQLATQGLRLPDLASNALLVGAKHSKSGHALAAMGPQVDYYSPEILDEYEIHAPGIASSGMVFPGAAPYPLIGHGKNFAWTGTTALGDNADTFAEKLCNPKGSRPTQHSDHYVYNGHCRPFSHRTIVLHTPASPTTPGSTPGTVTLRTMRSVHGPVFGFARSQGRPVALVRATAVYHHGVRSVIAFERLAENKANTPAQFLHDMHQFSGNENWFYVSKKHIAWLASGWFQRHARGTNLELPIWGTGRYDWRGFKPRSYAYRRHAASFNPHSVDPASGYLASWNNKGAPGWHATPGTWSFGRVQRVQLLRDPVISAIKHHQKLSLAQVVGISGRASTEDLRARKVLPDLLRVLGKVHGHRSRALVHDLRVWLRHGAHRRSTTGKPYDDNSAAVLTFDAWWRQAVHRVYDPVMGSKLVQLVEQDEDLVLDGRPTATGFFDGWQSQLSSVLRKVLGHHDASKPRFGRWCGSGSLGSCRRVLRSALQVAIKTVSRQQGKAGPAMWRKPVLCPDDPNSCDQNNITTAGAVATPAQPFENRGTFHQAVEIR